MEKYRAEDSSKQPESDTATEFLSSDLFSAVQQGDLQLVQTILSCAEGNVDAVDELGQTALFAAVKQGSVEIAEALLAHGADVNAAKHVLGRTALFAANEGNAGVVPVLLRYGADVTVVDSFGETVLLAAAKRGNAEVVQALLGTVMSTTDGEASAEDVSAESEIQAALFLAAKHNKAEVVEILLAHISDVNILTNGLNQTALFVAAKHGNVRVVEVLLRHGAEINVSDGEPALIVAAVQNDIAVVKTLLSGGADVDIVNWCGQTALFLAAEKGNIKIVRALLEHNADVNKTDSLQKTALSVAVRHNKVEVVELLLSYDANVNVVGCEGQTALFAAVEKENFKVVQALITHDADVNVSDREGKTALFDSAKGGNWEVVDALLRHGADVKVIDKDGQTALFPAAEGGNIKVVDALLRQSADATVVDKNGQTALFAAARGGNVEVVQALLKCGANVEVFNKESQTALFVAAQEGNIGIVRTLLSHDANVNAIDKKGQTALFAAASVGNVEVVKALLHINPANVNLIDEIGQTALFAAAKGGNVEVVQFLLCRISDLNLNLKVRDNCGQTVLFAAVEGGSSEVVQALLRHQLDVNATDHEGQTPLFAATNSLHDQMAQRAKVTTTRVTSDAICQVIDVLVSNGARADARNDAEETPLLHYLACGQSVMKNRDSVQTLIKVCHFLIKTKVSIKAISESGRTVIHLVLLLLRVVLKEEVQVTQETQVTTMLEIAQSCLELLCSIYSSPLWSEHMAAKHDGDGNTPLHLWASISYPRDQCSGDVSLESILSDIASKLFSHGEKCDTTNGRGETPLHMAQTWNAAKILIGQGADPKARDPRGNTPLLKHVKQNLTNRIFNQVYDNGKKVPVASQWSEILKSGMDPWEANSEGMTVLSSLLEEDTFDVIQALIDASNTLPVKECSCTHSNGDTCLHEICKDACKAPPVKEYPIDSNGDTCLHVICKDGSEDSNWKLSLIDLLVKSTPSIVNRQNRKGKTALHILCERGKADDLTCQMIEKLRAQGAEVDIPDSKETTCSDIASRNPILKELLEKDVKYSEGALCRPWSSKSEEHKDLLAQVARNQKVVEKVSFCYHTLSIGEGALGKVYAGLLKDGREAAVKCLKKERLDRPVGEREIENLVRLADCDQVVRYLHLEEDRHFLYIVLELMEGTVEKLLGRDVGVEKDDLVSLSKDVLSGLTFLHQNKILHRDIHPGNILFKKMPKGSNNRCSFQLRLADFGLSSKDRKAGENSMTVMHSRAGSRSWIAPELFTCRGTMVHSDASDVFACGLVLHYILSRRKHPFGPVDEANKSHHMVINERETNLLNKHTVIDKNLSPEAIDLVTSMVEYNGEDRPPAAIAQKHPLFWSSAKKTKFLCAVGNQPEFKREWEPQEPLPKMLQDLEYRLSSYCPWTRNIQDIYKEMVTLKQARHYHPKSIVSLLRFVRNSYFHVSEKSVATQNKLSKDFVILSVFPNLVLVVYKAVKMYKWDDCREIAACLDET